MANKEIEIIIPDEINHKEFWSNIKAYEMGYNQAIEDVEIESHIVKTIKIEFNWRWKKYIKGECTQEQFSRDFRKFLKHYANTGKEDLKEGGEE